MLRCMLLAAMEIPKDELQRARNQLRAMLMHNLESKAVAAEDMARQVAAVGHRMSEAELLDTIGESEVGGVWRSSKSFFPATESVTADEVRKLVLDLLQSPPAVGACGSRKVPITADELHFILKTNMQAIKL